MQHNDYGYGLNNDYIQAMQNEHLELDGGGCVYIQDKDVAMTLN